MTPAYRLRADRRDITDAVRQRLLRLAVTDEAGRDADAVELRLDDRDGALALPRKGAVLDVALGYPERGLAAMGLYTVDELELAAPPATLTIRAKAADMRAALKAQKTRAWDATTLGEVVGAIAADHHLEPRIAASLRTIRLPHLDQTEESDLHLLTRLARDHGAVAKPAGGNLLFVPAGQARSASGQAMPAVTVHRPQASSYRVTLADRDAYGSARAAWHDAASGQRRIETAGAGEPVFTLRRSYPSAPEAQAAAQAQLQALNRGKGTLSLTLQPGLPALRAEARLTLLGFRSGVDGAWIASRVTHEFGRAGYATSVEAEPPDA